MANRTKNATMHMRVSRETKATMEMLANAKGISYTDLVLGLINEEAARIFVHGCLGDISAVRAVRLVTAVSDPVLQILRSYHIAPAMLNAEDRKVCATITKESIFFAGGDEIFSVFDCMPKETQHVDKINIVFVQRNMAALRDYAQFVIKNPEIKLGFQDFLKAVSVHPATA